MCSIGKSMLWPKLIATFRRTRGSTRAQSGNLQSKLSVNEEYVEAFRTKSYTEMWSKVQVQLRRTNLEGHSSFGLYSRISENLLEPQQEFVINLISSSSDLHDLLIEYFEGSLEACRICGFLLQIIHQIRVNYCIIQRVVKLTKRVPSSGNCNDDLCKVILGELASFVRLNNPISSSIRLQFDALHNGNGLLIEKLISTRKAIAKRAKVVFFLKRAMGIGLVITCVTISTITLVLAIHSVVGIIAVPGLVTVPLATMKRNIKSTQRKLNTSILMRLGAQLDAAARGVYILNRDFDTLSQLVTRLHDEIERRRSISLLCLRSQRRQMLKEVVKEFKIHEPSFLELLGELEEHIYLCFLTINRARRLVFEETTADMQRHS